MFTASHSAKHFLLELAEAIGMRPIKDARWESEMEVPTDPALSGVSAVRHCTASRGILESHVAVHTWPEERAARIVVDSCADFDLDTAIEFCRFKLKAHHCYYLEAR